MTATTTRTRSKSHAARATEVAERDRQQRTAAANGAPAAPKETPQQTAKPKEPSAGERRALVFAALVKAAGELVERWDDPRVTRDEARAMLAHRLSYVPGKLTDLWDPRLGPVPTGRGKTTAAD